MIETRKILLTGTHLTPALELIRQLQNDRDFDWDIYYIGRKYNSSVSTEKSIESVVIPKLGIKFYPVHGGKFDRRWLPNTLNGLPQIFTGFQESQKIIKKIKPHLVVSFGGYISVPVIIASWLQKIPSLTHEQTHTLSLSTKINSLFCRYVALSFPSSNTNDKYVLTGNLLRREIYRQSSLKFHHLKDKLKKFPLIFLTAGNQGSHHLNEILKEILPTLTKKYTVVHQSGQIDFPKLNQLNYPNYQVIPYVDSKDIGWLLNNASVIISRAGANTTQEIAALHQKSILIPLLKSQQDEQYKNASWLKRRFPQGTIIIKDTDLSGNLLLDSISQLSKVKNKFSKTLSSPNLKLLKLIKRL